MVRVGEGWGTVLGKGEESCCRGRSKAVDQALGGGSEAFMRVTHSLGVDPIFYIFSVHLNKFLTKNRMILIGSHTALYS